MSTSVGKIRPGLHRQIFPTPGVALIPEPHWHTSTREDVSMARYGSQFGPDITFLGIDRCDLDELNPDSGVDV
ncbi:MAG: hypothetical protein H0T40_09750, partial [Geodermatophilaceae bacterium]|nr:hypothetical protein [Geodermatophilaceae bacterium]